MSSSSASTSAPPPKASTSRPSQSHGHGHAPSTNKSRSVQFPKVLSGEESVLLLLQHICRTFYDTEQAILIDSLRRKSVMRDDELAGTMLMQKKDVAAVAKRLIEDQLLSSHTRREAIEGTTKPMSYKKKAEALTKGQKLPQDDGPRMQNKTYYFIDPSQATDNIKWRLHQIRKVLVDQDSSKLDAQGYFCPLCKAQYTHFDAAELFDMNRNVLACSICGTEVVDNDTIQTKSTGGKMQKFTEQTKVFNDLLRSIEESLLPRFDIEHWLSVKDAEKAKNVGEGAVAEAARTAALNVQLAGDEDEEIEKQKREADAAEKRQQNQLPSWYVNPTIADDSMPELRRTEEEKVVDTAAEEVVVQDDQDDLDAYYARMQQSPKPPVLEALAEQSPLFSPITTGEEDDEFEATLTADMARKRSREGDTPDDSSKRPRVGEASEDEDDDEDEDPNPMIAVGDQMIPFDQITTAHTEAMTPEEYTIYFDHYSRLGE